MRRNIPLDDAEYEVLYGVLSGEKSFENWPKKYNSVLRQRVYRKWKKDQYEIQKIHDKSAGKMVDRIVCIGNHMVSSAIWNKF